MSPRVQMPRGDAKTDLDGGASGLSCTRRRPFSNVLLTCSIVALISSIAIRIVGRTILITDRLCVDRFSTRSSLQDALIYEWTDYNLPGPTPFRGFQSPDGESGWERAIDRWKNYYIPYKRKSIPALQSWKDSTDYLTLPGHPNTVLAMPEIWHQLHCVHMLRRYVLGRLHGDSQNTSTAGPPQDDRIGTRDRMHANHCIMLLKEVAQCQSDVSLVFLLPKTSLHGDDAKAIHTPHKCPKISFLDDWMEINHIWKGEIEF